MKRIFVYILLFFNIVALQSQELDWTQRSLITKKSATWCPYCGTWGWQLYDNLLNNFSDSEAILWTHHYSGDLMNPIGNAMAENFKASSQPVFFVNNTNAYANSDINTSFNNIKNYVTANNSNSTVIGLNSEIVLTNSKVDVMINFELSEDIPDAEIYGAAYFVEKSKIANQSGQGSNANHKNYLVSPIGDNFGNLVGVVESNQVYNVMLSGDLPAEFDKSNYIVDVIVWNKVDDTYRFVNGKSFDLQLLETKDQPVDKTGIYKCYQSNNQIVISFDIANEYFNSGKIYNSEGRVVRDFLIRNTSNTYIDSKDLESGIYLIALNGEKGISTSKLYLSNN